MPRFPRSATFAVALLAMAGAAHAQDNNLARNLAATCANCHGTNGQARGEMKPLAGLPASTITTMLGAYKSGASTGTIMQQIAKGYTDAQIELIANYLAAQPAKK